MLKSRLLASQKTSSSADSAKEKQYMNLFFEHYKNIVFILSADIMKIFDMAKRLYDSGTPISREQRKCLDREIWQMIGKGGLNSVADSMPDNMKSRWMEIFGSEYRNIIEYSFKRLPKTLRVNTLKISPEDFLQRMKLYKTSVIPAGINNVFRIPGTFKTPFYQMPEHNEGLFYVQDIASMLPPIALDPKAGDMVLDLCAAPGSKTTQMAQMMNNKGKILANDPSIKRVSVLEKQLRRLGVENTILSNVQGEALGDLHEGHFDKVLVDPPCSGEGIIRYKPHKIFDWKESDVYRLSEIQKGLIDSGFKALRAGGTMVYSTCTYSPEENEEAVNHLLKTHSSAEVIPVSLNGVKTRGGFSAWRGKQYASGTGNSVRIYPHDNDTIGFFLAKIIKN